MRTPGYALEYTERERERDDRKSCNYPLIPRNELKMNSCTVCGWSFELRIGRLGRLASEKRNNNTKSLCIIVNENASLVKEI